MVENKELTWARIFLIYNISGTIVYSIVSRTIADSLFTKIFFLVFDLFLVYWLSYHGVKQRNVISLIGKIDDFGIPLKKSSKENTVSKTSDKGRSFLMKKIHDYIVHSENFTNPELTIVELSEKLGIHPKRISATINMVQRQNFNSYVNRFRVKKAERLLKSAEMDKLTIEGIGNEVGFNSKSAFYSAFKKETGTTPLKYKELLAA